MSRVKLKLDENLGTRGREVFERFGYDVLTVSEQKLQSANDSRLVDICRQEARCLVSLDLDFANPLFFNPQTYAGLAVLRLPSAGGLADILRLSEMLASALAGRDIQGRLWIVQESGIREYQPDDDD